MALDMLDGDLLNYRHFRPTKGLGRPPMSLEAVLKNQLYHRFSLFSRLENFHVHIYDRRYLSRYDITQRMRPTGLRTALAVMTSTLRHLRITVSMPGENPWDFSRLLYTTCQRTSQTSFDEVFGNIQFDRIESIDLRNVRCDAASIASFLTKHDGTLQHLNVAHWACDMRLPDVDYMRELRTRAGAALRLLTLESCGSELGELCRRDNPGSNMKRYWYVDAERIAALLLDENLSSFQLPLAICHDIDLRIPC